jgi:hypothetical protein
MLPRHGLVVPTLTQLIFSVHTCHTTQGDRAADHLLCHRITPTVTAATDSAPRHVLEVHTAYVAQTRARCAYLDPADLALILVRHSRQHIHHCRQLKHNALLHACRQRTVHITRSWPVGMELGKAAPVGAAQPWTPFNTSYSQTGTGAG